MRQILMNILILQSGGTTPVINATLAGIITRSLKSGKNNNLYSSHNGIFGTFQNDIFKIRDDLNFAKKIINMPGSSITGTSRVGFLNDEEIDKFNHFIIKNKINFVINIGGNGTLQQSKNLSKKIPAGVHIASCPKTVDNDLGDEKMEDVFFTPGFPSCVNWWNKHLDLINIENLGAYTHDKVIVAQTFGRETGFICAACQGNNQYKDVLVYGIPESGISLELLEQKIVDSLRINKRCIVVISEGLFEDQLYHNYDLAGQIQFSSGESTSAQFLSNYLTNKGINSRSIIPNTMQRVFKSEVLNYDKEVAFTQGYKCMELLEQGCKNFLISLSQTKLKICHLNYDQIPENYSRKLKDEYITNHMPSTKYNDYLEKIKNLEGIYSISDFDNFS